MGNSSCTYHMCMASPQCGSTCVCQGFFYMGNSSHIDHIRTALPERGFSYVHQGFVFVGNSSTSITSVCLSAVWIIMCSIRFPFIVKIFSHSSHAYGFPPRWNIMSRSRFCLLEKLFPQWEQVKRLLSFINEELQDISSVLWPDVSPPLQWVL